MREIELLAPAGDMLSLKCAVFNGANAIYLGLSDFNARIKADNFTKENIDGVVKFAHLYGVKVYLTINTLIKNSEVNDFIKLVDCAYRARVDAFIVQDLGMAMLIKRIYPNAVLHASTQMGIHNLQGAKFLEELGFSRVVLARETKLEDIKLIKQQTNLEIEYFVQGALCVAFSGNCYLSAIKNGNSGNRGKCLQLCRLPYNAYVNGKKQDEKYYLSCKDLCLMRQLDALIDAGVTSLKIEGRLKRASYVAQVVRSYRKIIDNHITDTDKIVKEQKKIQEIFSRGEFNETAYLYDNFNIINSNINNHEGKYIGSVTKFEKFKDLFKITLRLTEPIAMNDAIRLINGNKVVSIGVGNVNKIANNIYEIFSKTMASVGDKVYLLKSSAKEGNLTQFERKLPIDMCFCAHVNQKPKLTADCGGCSVSVDIEETISIAQNRACTYDDVYKQVSKLNDTYFILQTLNLDIDDNIFVPVSILNELRRRVVDKLLDAMINNYNTSMPEMTVNDYKIAVPQLQTKYANYVMIDEAMKVDKVNSYILPK